MIPKDKIAESSDAEITAAFPDFLVAEKPDEEYIKSFLERAAKISDISVLVDKLTKENSAQIESSSTFLQKKFVELPSDLTRLVVWKLSTDVPADKLKVEKQRLRAIFKALGKDYNTTYKRVVAGLPKGNATEKFNLATVTARIKK